LASLNNVHQLLPADDRKKVQVVFISVDPKRDTPAQLKQYVPFFNSTFLGATTSEEQVKKIARDYGAFFEYEPQLTNDTKDNYTVTHSAYVYLIDSAGQFSVLYDYEQLSDAARIAEDIEKILHQDS
jgi:protein SCO1/2